MYVLLALAAGAGLAFQAVINARLRVVLGSALWAGMLQVFVGLVAFAAVVLVARQWPPSPAGLLRAPWWVWTGGALGAAYVLAVILATAPLGAALTIAAVVVGQTAAALVIDHYGWFGVEVQRASPARILGGVLLVGGVLLIRGR